MVGEIGDAEKPGLLGNALALLFPIDWPEPFGLVMAEALACGTPVVAGVVARCPEVVTHGLTGLIGETDDELAALWRRFTRSTGGPVETRRCGASRRRRWPMATRRPTSASWRHLLARFGQDRTSRALTRRAEDLSHPSGDIYREVSGLLSESDDEAPLASRCRAGGRGGPGACILRSESGQGRESPGPKRPAPERSSVHEQDERRQAATPRDRDARAASGDRRTASIPRGERRRTLPDGAPGARRRAARAGHRPVGARHRSERPSKPGPLS